MSAAVQSSAIRRRTKLLVLPLLVQIGRDIATYLKLPISPGWTKAIDTIFIVTSLNQDYNLRRLERYLALVREGGAAPVIAHRARALDPGLPILGFARRMTAYKRPDLLFTDLERLQAIARTHPFQIVLAGKAHPHDAGGKRLIEQLHALMRELEGVVPIAFLPDYDMDNARALVAGSDVWLNTPLRPYEASGTSGMKAAFNGVPSLSVLDGWWVEGCIEGVTGWAIGNDTGADDGAAAALYDKLEQVVLPLYYAGDPGGWARVMRGAISKSASYFNSSRMMRRYAAEAYLR